MQINGRGDRSDYVAPALRLEEQPMPVAGDRFSINVSPRAHSYYPPARPRSEWKRALMLFAAALPVMFLGLSIESGKGYDAMFDAIAPAAGNVDDIDNTGGNPVPEFIEEGAWQFPAGGAVAPDATGDNVAHVRLRLGDTVIDARVDPTLEHSVLNPVDMLNSGIPSVGDGAALWIDHVEIGGHVLNDVAITVAADLAVDTTIGRDLLAPTESADHPGSPLELAAR